MNINTKLIIALGVVFVICVSVVTYFVLTQNKTNTQNNQPNNSSVYSESDLKNKAIKTDLDILTLADQPNFYITYSLTTKEFILGLTPQDELTDYNDLRLEAENKFIEVLNIFDKQKLCSENVSVLVPPSYKPEYSGFNYGLSFCSGSLKF